ncbi:COG4705 family protein [Dictyobacter formicarum]|uniref:Membrane protein n=1 Tax=Dictyobacter formicarum TaxID=2778368 RepID=A0ABQ3VDM2_9CHLR|nr:hypothetical protein [Dictyobacter formicarum]GHO84227.1 membrane protein [Dictyobacter formicarum]
MHKTLDTSMSKVPALTLAFWLIKIAATTLGETGGDAVSMTMNLGYALATAIFFAFFLVTVAAQVRAKRFHPFLYWAVIVATTTAGTTIADYADRSLGIGYVGGSLLLFTLLIALLGLWRISLGSVSVDHVTSPRVEIFYWVTILFSNTLGTALGDFLADASGLGYEGGAIVFSAALVLVAAVYYFTRGRATKISRTWLFWMAFILTRPLGATVGDLLTKAHEHGGFNLSRVSSSAVIAFFIILCILFTSQRTVNHLRQRNLIS